MKQARFLVFLLINWSVVLCLAMHNGFSQISSEIRISGHKVIYISGKTVYAEELLDERWVGRYWNAEGRMETPGKPWIDEAFEIHIKDTPTPPTMPGISLSRGWKWFSASELRKNTDQGSRHAVVELSNSVLPIKLKIHTVVDGTSILKRWLNITNTSGSPVALSKLSPWSGRLWSAEAPINLCHSIRWQGGWEGWVGWTPLRAGTNSLENNRGLAYDDPFFILRNESNGEYFFGHLAWPVNYLMEFQNAGGLTFKVGPTAINALRVIAGGETITTPAVDLGMIKGDFDATVQAMLDHVRRTVLPKRNPRLSYLVQDLLPEDQPLTVYRGNDYNEENVKREIDVAAAAGLELIIVDGPTWCTAYGNWLVPDPKRFPRGLDPVREYAHQKGMLFGLYAEPEGGREGFCSGTSGVCIGGWDQSDVFKQHPGWFFLPKQGSILNLAIPEAAAYLEAELGRIIEHYKLDLYRHDFNAPLLRQGSETLRDGFVECDYWRYYDALHSMLARLRTQYPNVIIHQASGGGTRLDLASVGYWEENYTSDRVSHPYVYQMSSGLSVYLPPEILVTPHGMAGNARNQPDLETMLRGAYTLGNTPMIFNAMLPKSLEEFKPEVQKRFRRYSDLYKNFIRPMIAVTMVYHHAPVNATGGVETGNWFAMEFTSPDKTRGWATVIRLSGDGPASYLLKPKGLNTQKQYKVTFDNTSQTKIMNAWTLMKEGLLIQPTEQVASELLLFEEQ